jgi:polysaccharide export outer membrane protein
LKSFAQATPTAPTKSPTTVPAPTPVTVPPDYTLGAGDVLLETVINHPEFSSPISVPTGGVVVFPVAGSKNVTGMTVSEVTDFLTKALKKELKYPRVVVVITTPRPQQAFVYGDVQKPGPIPVLPGMRLADAFNSAGGLSADFKLGEAQITLLTRSGTKLNAPLVDVLSSAPNSNPLLHDGDTVNVDAGWFICYVIGQVKTPGAEHMKRGAGLMEAIAGAGGSTDQALLAKVQITHQDKSVEVVDLVPSLVHGEHQTLPDLKPGDLVTVAQNLDNFTILGYVQLPGVYPIPQGRTFRLTDAISIATGSDKDPNHKARMSKVRVDHKVDGKSVSKMYDVGRYLTKGDTTQNPEIVPGDVIYVPETNQVSAGTLAQIVSALGIGYYYLIK